MYVSPVLAEALLEVVPELGAKPADVHALLREQYRNSPDITDDEFRSAAADVLTSSPPRLESCRSHFWFSMSSSKLSVTAR